MANKLREATFKVNEIAKQIDAIEEYSYNYNIKIVGVPQITDQESAETTASLCLKLFIELGIKDITIEDIDIAHWVPRWQNNNISYKHNAITWKFIRRLAKDKAMKRRKATKNPVCSH